MTSDRIEVFNFSYHGLVETLLTPVKISQDYDPLMPLIDMTSKMDLKAPRTIENEFWGVWDTGATGTHISQRVVDALSLEITGFKDVTPAVGETVRQPTFDVTVYLPNKVCFGDMEVTLWNFEEGDHEDILIGMDIITTGDLAITNQEGKTNLSFRFPTRKTINFVADLKHPKIGKYDPCFCGSQKQFKFCHWKP